MAMRRGDPVPEDATAVVKDMAQAFIPAWCVKSLEKAKAKEAQSKAANTVEVFAGTAKSWNLPTATRAASSACWTRT